MWNLGGSHAVARDSLYTTASPLLQAAGVINAIRVWIGQGSLKPTNRYAEIDLETKARSLRACASNIPEPAPVAPNWHNDPDSGIEQNRGGAFGK